MLTPLHKQPVLHSIPPYRPAVPDVLVAEPGSRPSRRALLGGAVVLLVLSGTVLLRDGPPGPLVVRLASLDGSALRGESFVRLQLGVSVDGGSELAEVRLLLAGASALGLSPDGLVDGEATVQVDLVPPCPQAVQEYVDAELEVVVLDEAGRSRTVRLALPDDGPLERLVRFRCASLMS